MYFTNLESINFIRFLDFLMYLIYNYIMKTLILVATILTSINSLAKENHYEPLHLIESDSPISLKNHEKVHSQSREFNLLSFAMLGLSFPQTESRDGTKDFGAKIVSEATLGFRYSFLEKVAFQFELSKLFTGGELSNNFGNLSHSMNAGLTIALSGNTRLHNKKEIFKQVSKNKRMAKSTVVSTIGKTDFDGFRINISASQMEFSKLEDTTYGYSASLFYESLLLKKNSDDAVSYSPIQYGVKYTGADTSKVKIQLLQVFVGIGFFP